MTETKSLTGKKDVFLTQLKVVFILAVARIGGRWEPSHQRNDNHGMACSGRSMLFYLFWRLGEVCTTERSIFG